MIAPHVRDLAIAARCAALGLSHAQAQQLAAADPVKHDLVQMLGLDHSTLEPIPPKRWLWIAAQTSCVSYREMLTPDELLTALTTGEVPTAFTAHIVHFLEEAPMLIVVMAVEQAAQQADMPITSIWRNINRLAVSLGGRRLGQAFPETPQEFASHTWSLDPKR